MQADQEQIRQRAHELWEKSGKPVDRDKYFWTEAERQLKEEMIEHELKTPDTL